MPASKPDVTENGDGRIRFGWTTLQGTRCSQWIQVPETHEHMIAESLRHFFDYAQREAMGMVEGGGNAQEPDSEDD